MSWVGFEASPCVASDLGVGGLPLESGGGAELVSHHRQDSDAEGAAWVS